MKTSWSLDSRTALQRRDTRAEITASLALPNLQPHTVGRVPEE